MKAPLIANRFKLAEYVRQVWHITPRPEDGPDCLSDPGWYAHVSRQMKRGDKIEVEAEDGSWYAEGKVMDTGSFGAKVALTLGPVKLTNDAVIEAPDEFEVKWAGPHAKYRVVRRTDNKVLKDQCQTQEEAATWIKSHRKAMAA